MTIIKFPSPKSAQEALVDAAHLAEIVIVGVDGDGGFHFDYSGDDLAYVNLLLDQAKKHILEDDE